MEVETSVEGFARLISTTANDHVEDLYGIFEKELEDLQAIKNSFFTQAFDSEISFVKGVKRKLNKINEEIDSPPKKRVSSENNICQVMSMIVEENKQLSNISLEHKKNSLTNDLHNGSKRDTFILPDEKNVSTPNAKQNEISIKQSEDSNTDTHGLKDVMLPPKILPKRGKKKNEVVTTRITRSSSLRNDNMSTSLSVSRITRNSRLKTLDKSASMNSTECVLNTEIDVVKNVFSENDSTAKDNISIKEPVKNNRRGRPRKKQFSGESTSSVESVEPPNTDQNGEELVMVSEDIVTTVVIGSKQEYSNTVVPCSVILKSIDCNHDSPCENSKNSPREKNINEKSELNMKNDYIDSESNKIKTSLEVKTVENEKCVEENEITESKVDRTEECTGSGEIENLKDNKPDLSGNSEYFKSDRNQLSEIVEPKSNSNKDDKAVSVPALNETVVIEKDIILENNENTVILKPIILDETVVLTKNMDNNSTVILSKDEDNNKIVALSKNDETVVLSKNNETVVLSRNVENEKLLTNGEEMSIDSLLPSDFSEVEVEETPPKIVFNKNLKLKESTNMFESPVKNKVRHFEKLAEIAKNLQVNNQTAYKNGTKCSSAFKAAQLAVSSAKTLRSNNAEAITFKIVPSKDKTVPFNTDGSKTKETIKLKEDQKKKREAKHRAVSATRENKEKEKLARFEQARIEKEYKLQLEKEARIREEIEKKKLAQEERRKQEEKRKQEALKKAKLQKNENEKKRKQQMSEEKENKMLKKIEVKQKNVFSPSVPKVLNPNSRVSNFISPNKIFDDMMRFDEELEASDLKHSEKEKEIERRKPIWAREPTLSEMLRHQKYIRHEEIDKLFSVKIFFPDMTELFPNIDRTRIKRTSSVIWKPQPRCSMMPNS